jgi:hypothetical protein
MTEFRKKLQKQEGWYAEGENFDVLAARTKEGEKYQYTLSVSLSKKHKLYRKAKRENIMFARKLFDKVNVPYYGAYRYEKEKRDPIVVGYDFPEGFDSLNGVMKYAEKVFDYLSSIK